MKSSFIDNSHLLNGLHSLSLYYENGQIRKMDNDDLNVEELGDVYENLLRINNKRKTTGSYYTPLNLVEELIKTALDPVIKEKIAHKNKKIQEEAILSIKIIDPACGSGHFLLAAAKKLGKELAKIRTGDTEPNALSFKEAIRDVVQNCIYGVDLNPLAINLCKVGLWIQSLCDEEPLLSFNHQIKYGNSLVGVLDLKCLKDKIPSSVLKNINECDKIKIINVKKNNKKVESLQLVLPLSKERQEVNKEYTEETKALEEVSEINFESIKEQFAKYQELKDNIWNDHSACNLWTAAFLVSPTNEFSGLSANSISMEMQEKKLTLVEIVENSNKLAKKYHFFHWQLEFPEVFKNGGFDCVLGNPPWERIKIQQKEFFASRSNEIATAKNVVARDKLIKKLPQENPQLAQEFEQAIYDAKVQSNFIRKSGRFPLTGVGDINTYSIFAETARNLIKEDGRVGIIVPTGIATDNTYKMFFNDLIKQQHLASLYDFQNKEKLFTAVSGNMNFCLLSISKKKTKESKFGFFLNKIKQLEEEDRIFNLTSEEIALFNPNTLTCPVFKCNKDVQLTKKIYYQFPVIENEKTGVNPWGISLTKMINSSRDYKLFEDKKNDNSVPLYEGKMIYHFNHRCVTYTSNGKIRRLTETENKDPYFTCLPRYWINKADVDERFAERWKHSWFLGFRDISRATNERTTIFSLLPKVGINDTVPIIMFEKTNLASCLVANLSSLVFDYVARQKIGALNVSFFIVKQLPIIPPEKYTQKDIEYITPRVLELVYTTWDMRPFALEMGYEGEPFLWNTEKRALIRSELDAYYGKLYNLSRDEMRYILDPKDIYGSDFSSESFKVLKNNELKMYGEYKTQRLILQAWDKLS